MSNFLIGFRTNPSLALIICISHLMKAHTNLITFLSKRIIRVMKNISFVHIFFNEEIRNYN